MVMTEHNKRVEALLSKMFAEGKVPHAFALVSDEYIDAAKNIAASIICEKRCYPPCGKCRHCLKVKKGIHPDVIELAPQKGKVFIGVDAVREMRSDAYILPNDADAKVYFINGACSMNEAAQNALLIILEQPPENVYFILGDNRKNELLPTVLSRVTLFTLDGAQKNKKEKYADKVNEVITAFTENDEAECYLLLSSVNKREQAEEFLSELSDTLYGMIREKSVSGEAPRRLTLFFDKVQKALQRLQNAGNLSVTLAELNSSIFGGR